jgi:FkbM family methyltransferase
MITFERITHQIEGRDVVFVLDADARDRYSEGLRRAIHYSPCDYHLNALVRLAAAHEPVRFVDVGANVGTVSLPAALAGAQVLSVEANPLNFVLLSEAVRANGFEGRMLPYHAAAYSRPDVLAFAGDSAWGRVVEHSGGITVPGDTIANIMAITQFRDATLLKIDIEGAELAALTDLESVVTANPRLDLIVESNSGACNRNGYAPQDLWARLEALGFTVYLQQSPAGWAREASIPISARIAPVTPRDPQPRAVMDVLASRRRPTELRDLLGYTIAPFTEEEVREDFERVLLDPKQAPPNRTHVLRQERYLPVAWREAAWWPPILARLRAEFPDDVDAHD